MHTSAPAYDEEVSASSDPHREMLWMTWSAGHRTADSCSTICLGPGGVGIHWFLDQKGQCLPNQGYAGCDKEFPRPTDISGVRSWFGLFEQVAWCYSKQKLMEPFPNLLKPKTAFAWSQELQDAFLTARDEIVKIFGEGVLSFKVCLWLNLITDWIKVGMGYNLWQKRCGCKKIHPTWCRGR